jgi:prepilin-type processing-associated H-X9-DG protein
MICRRDSPASRPIERFLLISCWKDSHCSDFNAYPLFWYNAESGFWFDELQPYAGATFTSNLFTGQADSTSQLYLCPSYARAVGNAPPWPYTSDGWKTFGPYGYNWFGVGTDLPTLGLGGNALDANEPYDPPIKASDVVCPSQMVAITDANFSWAEPPNYSVGSSWLQLSIPALAIYGSDQSAQGVPLMLAADKRRHDAGRRNVLFCDGHVDCLTWPQLFNFHDYTVLSLWNNDHQPHPELTEGW